MNGQLLMNKGEQHGTSAARVLAVPVRNNNALPVSARPPPTDGVDLPYPDLKDCTRASLQAR